MQSPVCPPLDAGDVEALYADLKIADAAIRRAVVRAGQLSGSGVVERVEGGPLEWALGMACRLTGSDRRMIVAAGETLEHLPTVSALWAQQLISWGQVRAIVLAVRRLPISGRAAVDARVAATVAAYDGIDVFDPDHLVDAVDRAVAELSDPRNAERREERAPLANFVAVQLSLDGRVKGWFDYDQVNGAVVINGLDAASTAPSATADPQPDQPTTRGQQYAAGLVEMASEYLSGVNGDLPRAGEPEALAPRRRRRRARPLVIVHVDVADITRGEAGVLELNVRGRLARITSATLDLLSRDADMRAVLFDGARPLAVSSKLHADKISDDVRLAVRARDMGDRWPGSNAPIGHTEIHHFTHRADGGTNDLDKLGSFNRDVHLNRIHKHGWKVSLDPPTGIITIRRKGRTWRSLPRTVGLARPPDNRPADRGPPRSARMDYLRDEPLPF